MKKKKEMIPLTNKENESYEKQKVCDICKKEFSTDKNDKKIPVVFHNGSTYNYHFIIKQLAKTFKGQFECLGENSEKYITFSVPIKKELDNGKTITYKLKFIDSFRFTINNKNDNPKRFILFLT